MAKKELAIVFDDYSVRIIEGKVTDTAVKRVYNTYLRDDVNLFKEGVFDVETWEQVLKDVKNKRIFKAKRVHVILPTSIVILREKELPNFSKEQLKAIVSGELASTSLFPFSDPQFDLVRVESRAPMISTDGEKLYNHILVAAPSSIINQIINSLIKHRFKPISVDIAANAMNNFCMAYADPGEHQVKMLSQIGDHGFDIHIFDNGNLFFTRHIPKDINLMKTESGWLDEIKLAEAFVYESERAKSYFNFTMNYRDRQISRMGLISSILLTDTFLERVMSSSDTEICLITRMAPNIPRHIRQQTGFELAIGALLRGVGK